MRWTGETEHLIYLIIIIIIIFLSRVRPLACSDFTLPISLTSHIYSALGLYSKVIFGIRDLSILNKYSAQRFV
jgi:hypothetical protein